MIQGFVRSPLRLAWAAATCCTLVGLPTAHAQSAPAASRAATAAGYADRPEAQALIDSLAAQNVNRDFVTQVLRDARYSRSAARATMPPSSPGVRSWTRYRARFVDAQRINAGLAFWQQNRDVLAQAQARYGVPASVIVSIIGVETFYGRIMGDFRIIDALATLGFDFPSDAPRDRSEFFRAQLGEFLVLSHELGIDPRNIRGSFAGAIGLPQFMPGSIRRFAVAHGGGTPDLINRPQDAVMSVANFLVEHGWQPGMPVFAPVGLPADPAPLVDGGLTPTLDWSQLRRAGAAVPPEADSQWAALKVGMIDLVDGDTGRAEYRVAFPNFFVITQYNRSYFYATAVADLAEALAQAGPADTAPIPPMADNGLRWDTPAGIDATAYAKTPVDK